MEKMHPKKILEEHIRKNPEIDHEVVSFEEEGKVKFDDDFESNENQREIVESLGSISEDKEEIRSKQYNNIEERFVDMDKKFYELIEKIQRKGYEIQELRGIRKNAEERSKRLDLNHMARAEFNKEATLSQMTRAGDSIENLSRKIENNEIQMIDLTKEFQDIMKIRKTIESFLIPSIKDGESLNRYEMN